MRYQLFGKKSSYYGKTLWEIVGNLKNFGVGRLVKTDDTTKFPELSFFKILKVQAIPPPKHQFLHRNVMVWIEEVYRDRKLEVKCTVDSNYVPKFHLIPKIEEQNYLERLKEIVPPKKYVKKYCYWPPLYKIIWEKNTEEGKTHGPIPKLKCLHEDYPGGILIEEEEETKPDTCSLYKGELTVDEMYKEIVRLKLLIEAKTNA